MSGTLSGSDSDCGSGSDSDCERGHGNVVGCGNDFDSNANGSGNESALGAVYRMKVLCTDCDGVPTLPSQSHNRWPYADEHFEGAEGRPAPLGTRPEGMRDLKGKGTYQWPRRPQLKHLSSG